MDARNGRIIEESQLQKYFQEHPEARGRMVPMEELPTRRQMLRRPPRVGRNEPCPCGSGKKFKQCCFIKAAEATKEIT